jgi:putative transport protein
MHSLLELNTGQPVADAIGVIVLVCMAGMALGSVKVRGAGLGSAGVLFAGIVTGHFGKPVDAGTLDFVKEFGLILFVFTIGLQLGPGFFAALRQQGLRMNALAAAIVVLGAVCAPLAGWIAAFDPAAVLGIFSGASINMPSLGAATQTLSTLPGIAPDRLALPALASAVTFPTAIVASLAAVLVLKHAFRIDPAREAREFAEEQRSRREPLERRTLVVTNPNLDGVHIDSIPGRLEAGVTVSRLQHGATVSVATDHVTVRRGDRLVAVGTQGGLDQFERVVGQRSTDDLASVSGDVTFRRIAVTAADVLGKSVGELDLDDRFGVAVTRVTRADLEMTAAPGLRLQFGDVVQVVGRDADLDRAAAALGNSLKELNETHFIPLFIGMFLGILVGTLPIAVPGLPQPVRLGLAGGPLIVALVLGRFGRIGRLASHMPLNANLAFREFGIALFFAAVGLAAGPTFFRTVVSPTGVAWMLAGVCVTTLPLIVVGSLARAVWKMNFVALSGLLAGSMTAPPVLTFANELSGSDAPTVAYAMVYPLTMLLRVLTAQTLTFALCG